MTDGQGESQLSIFNEHIAFASVRKRTEQLKGERIIFHTAISLNRYEGAFMKFISVLKNAAGSILLAGVMVGITGFVHAQTSGSGQTGGAMSGQGGSTSGPGGAMSGQGGSTSGEAITGQRNSQGDGTTDTTGKGTSGKDDSYSMSPRKKGSGSTGQGAGSGSSQGTGSSGGSSGSGSGGY